eukprot:TRINITY_DN2598_c0_g1_i1.p1 TRINITY_DN2598_c0_g1~~TRINITY_DN2598_c0_g1_i1.p1  ORF type:complete len:549 (-),score=122.42 TRINITY_DN2598_c0_g1_i1:1637-3283(-)
MTDKQVVIVKTGIANIGSVVSGLDRQGYTSRVIEGGEEVLTAKHVIVPGVGHFSQAMHHIREHNLEGPILERIKRGLPTLFVCVGLQILGATSEEGDFLAKGLGLVQAPVHKFPPTVRVPQQGWNRVSPSAGMKFVVEGYAYYSNSFAFQEFPADQGWNIAHSYHGVPFIAAFEKGPVLACQFHPELSGEWGQALLARWLSLSPSIAASDWATSSLTIRANLPSASSYPEKQGVTRRIIPCLDVKNGMVVKGIQFQNLKESGIPSERAASIAASDWATSSLTIRANLPSASSYPEKQGVTRRIIPCLDVKNGMVVKGIQFQNLKESGIPSERAALYQSQGGDEIVILDVSATIETRKTRYDTVQSVRNVLSIPLTVGGGVTSVSDAQALLMAGADKVAVNSAAVKEPALLTAMATAFGRQCVVVAIDAVQTGPQKWEVVVRAGKEKTGIDVVAWAKQAVHLGAGEVLLTSWDRDGTKSGYDLELLLAVSKEVNVPVIASGGAASEDHLADGLAHGADAVLAASIFHYEEYTPQQLKQGLKARGLPIRI